MSLASVNVDLDSLGHYARIHGLAAAVLPARAASLVGREAVERFAELFARVGIRATFFAVGQDLSDTPSADALRAVAQSGHEVGNHTFTHDYALTRRSEGSVTEDVIQGHRAIAGTVGRAPVGFRAPGYTLTGPLLHALCDLGYRYDASVFPAAPYWAAKAAVMTGLAVAGRRSEAILDRPGVLLAPRLPYRPDLADPYRRGNAPLVELPVTVHPMLRVPIIGTTVTVLPPRLFGLLWRGVARLPFVNLELHGIDLLDAKDAGCPALAAAQRDLEIAHSVKQGRLEEALRRVAGELEVVPLAEAAERLAPQLE